MIIGIMGMIILISAYFLVIAGKLDPKNKIYLGLNIFASFLLGYYAYSINSWPFLAINVIWIIGSVYQMIRNGKK